MPKKGVTNNPNGRPGGSVNKSTKAGREAIAAFVDGNADRLNSWLDMIAMESPKDAFNCFMNVVEYHIPKLARVENEHSGQVAIYQVNSAIPGAPNTDKD